MPRLFIGLPLPEAYRDRIADVIHALDERLTSRVKWVSPDNAHITLQFLGQAQEDQVDPIRYALGDIAAAPIILRAGQAGCYPDTSTPRVAWLGLRQGEPECAALSTQVKAAMHPFGFKAGNRPYHGHITLGRIKQLRQEDWQAALDAANHRWPEIVIDRFMLWESELTPDGPIYTPVQTFPLDG